MAGRFGNAGQACTSSKRLIVEASVWDEFLEAFLTKVAHWQMGDPTDEQTRLGPMSSVAGRDELAEQVDDAIAKRGSRACRREGPGVDVIPTVVEATDYAG